MRHKKACVLSLPLLLLAACTTPPASLNLMPLEDGSYRGLAVAANETQALRGSLRLAESTCLERQLRHAVIRADTRFRGPPLRTAERRDLAAGLATYVNTPPFPWLDANDDYEADLHFKCV